MTNKLQSLIRDPGSVFEEPRELLKRSDLSTREKIVVLQSWQADLIEMQKAVEENMPSANRDLDTASAKLGQVRAAITALTEPRNARR